MKRKTACILGTIALLATATLAASLGSAEYLFAKLAVIGLSRENERQRDEIERAIGKNADLFYIPPNETSRFYALRHQQLSEDLNKLARKSGAAVDEKRRRYWTALKETKLRILFHPDTDRPLVANRSAYSNCDYHVQLYCELCGMTKDVDGIKKLEKELAESNFSQAAIESYQRYARVQELKVEIAVAVEEKNDAELEKRVATLEEVAINDAMSPETDFASQLPYLLQMIDSYNPALGQKAREIIKKGYEESVRPALADAYPLKAGDRTVRATARK